MSRIYLLARMLSIRNKYRIIRRSGRKGALLDIGCGTGEFLAYCRKGGYTVTGVEPNERARNFAITENRIQVSETLEGLGKPEGTFDCITLWHVLEHVHDLDAYMETIKKLLCTDGTLVIAVPNSNSWDAEKYKEFWAAYDVPRHLYHFTSGTMKELANRKGFDVEKIIPQKLDAYYVSMLSEKYLLGKISYLKSAFIGFWSNRMAKNGNRGHSSLIFILKIKKGPF